MHTAMTNRRIAVLGAGNMGRALITGLVGAAATGLFAPRAVAAPQRAVAEQLLRSVGEVIWVASEDALDVVTALSGSGPAYLFLLAQLMAEAGERLGLEGTAARRLAAVTLYGAGLLATSGDGDLARLRAEVTSPGGTTEAALRVLEDAKLSDTVAASRRGYCGCGRCWAKSRARCSGRICRRSSCTRC